MDQILQLIEIINSRIHLIYPQLSFLGTLTATHITESSQIDQCRIKVGTLLEYDILRSIKFHPGWLLAQIILVKYF